MLAISDLDAKPVLGYPGYYITQDGQVYSTRHTRTGAAKPIKTHSKGCVTLYQGDYERKQVSVKKLVQKVWG